MSDDYLSWMPEEAHRYQEAVASILQEKDPGDPVEKWAALLLAWRQHFEKSPYEQQASQLLRPLLENYAHQCVKRYLEAKNLADLDLALSLQQELVQRFPEELTFLVNLGKCIGIERRIQVPLLI